MDTRCVRCLAPNRDGRRFCHACGANLPGGCARCGFVNRATERWCGGCGTLVGLSDVAERRQLTVLFCDLVGSTALSTRLDAEDLRELITAYQGVCAAEIAAFDGFVARYFGDGILAYFGWPTAREDAPERCVRAGLAIAAAVRSRRGALAESQAGRDLALEVRIGVATGEVVVGDLIGAGASEERAVVGETPNLAARLQSLAHPGEVVIAATTRALIGDLFEVVDRGEHALKGFLHPVRAWGVTAAATVASRFQARHATLLPLVGRDAELAALSEAWRAARDGAGRVVHVVADPGFGKSRLVEALRAQASDARWLVLQGSPYHATTALHPVIEHLRRSGVDPGDPGTRALALLLGHPDPCPSLPIPTRDAMREAVVTGLLGPDAALVVVVEDAQWLDPSTAEVLRALADRVRARPALLVVTERTRPGLTDLGPDATRVSIGRLDVDAARALARAVAGAGLDALDVDRIVDRSDGVPLFVEELTRAALVAGGGDGVPATLADALMARLDRDDGTRELAQAAAVLGREFDADVALALLDTAGAQASLDGLVADEVLVGTSDPGRLTFRHALVRDLAYNSLLRRRRRQLHRRAADVLGERRREPEVVAWHLELAEEDAEAITWWERASEEATRRAATLESVAHLRRAWTAALRLPPGEETGRRRVHVATALASGLRVLNQTAEGLETIRCAHREAEAVGLVAGREVAAMWICEGNLRFWLGDTPGCERAHAAGLDAARGAGATDLEAAAHGGLGDAAYSDVRIDEAQARFEQCVDLAARHGHAAIEAAHRPMLVFCEMYRGDLDRAEAAGVRALSLATQARAFRAECLATMALGFVWMWRGERERAAAVLRRGCDLANRLGSVMFRLEGAYLLAAVAATRAEAQGHLDDLDRDVPAPLPDGLVALRDLTLLHAAADPREAVARALQRLADGSMTRFMEQIVMWELLDASVRLDDLALCEAVVRQAERSLILDAPHSARTLARARAVLQWRATPSAPHRAALEAEREVARQLRHHAVLPVLDRLLAGSAEGPRPTGPSPVT